MSLTLEAQQLSAPEIKNLATVETGNPVDSLITDFRQDQIEMLERCRQCAMSRLSNSNEITNSWTRTNCNKSGCPVYWMESPEGGSTQMGTCIGKCWYTSNKQSLVKLLHHPNWGVFCCSSFLDPEMNSGWQLEVQDDTWGLILSLGSSGLF